MILVYGSHGMTNLNVLNNRGREREREKKEREREEFCVKRGWIKSWAKTGIEESSTNKCDRRHVHQILFFLEVSRQHLYMHHY